MQTDHPPVWRRTSAPPMNPGNAHVHPGEASVTSCLRHAYVTTRYVDHLVGQLVAALKQERIYEQTTVIFWGDHGYKLGEHCDWFK